MLMDEPFSAVDPVVRHDLQEEFLRLQGELGKTIVFVTHDIDEAVKLGDQVAVMRVGGKLAQLAPPAELMTRTADAFVAGFVGSDSGYRAFAFDSAGALPTHDEPTVVLGSDLAAAPDGWVLVLDDQRKPQGWLENSARRSGQIVPELMHRGGTLATQNGSLRAALDAALSSPSGRGVVIDDEGRLIGTVTTAEVVELIERQAASSRATPSTAEAAT
jgi:osmoprotectant transport system ATP-binding protein